MYSFSDKITRHVAFHTNERKTLTHVSLAAFVAKTIASHAFASRASSLYIPLKSTFFIVAINVAWPAEKLK